MWLRSALEAELKGAVSYGANTDRLNTWGIGGTADILAIPRSGVELIRALGILNGSDRGFFLLGGGSNVLLRGGAIEKPLLVTTAVNEVRILPEGGKSHIYLDCDAGVRLKDLFSRALREGWSGLEFAAGIPGTLGGALIGNAGTGGGSIGDVVYAVRMMDRGGGIRELAAAKMKWAYRYSPLEDLVPGGAVLSAVLKLDIADCSCVKERSKAAIDARREQPLGARTAGCVFKNPQGGSAGMLLDRAGCKGLSVGGARVSQRHANFIENVGGATSGDILRLSLLCRDRVREATGVKLLFEIRGVGFGASLDAMEAES